MCGFCCRRFRFRGTTFGREPALHIGDDAFQARNFPFQIEDGVPLFLVPLLHIPSDRPSAYKRGNGQDRKTQETQTKKQKKSFHAKSPAS